MQFGPILVIEQQMFNTALAITNIKNDQKKWLLRHLLLLAAANGRSGWFLN